MSQSAVLTGLAMASPRPEAVSSNGAFSITAGSAAMASGARARKRLFTPRMLGATLAAE